MVGLLQMAQPGDDLASLMTGVFCLLKNITQETTQTSPDGAVSRISKMCCLHLGQLLRSGNLCSRCD